MGKPKGSGQVTKVVTEGRGRREVNGGIGVADEDLDEILTVEEMIICRPWCREGQETRTDGKDAKGDRAVTRDSDGGNDGDGGDWDVIFTDIRMQDASTLTLRLTQTPTPTRQLCPLTDIRMYRMRSGPRISVRILCSSSKPTRQRCWPFRFVWGCLGFVWGLEFVCP